jgi:hypothetical protein
LPLSICFWIPGGIVAGAVWPPVVSELGVVVVPDSPLPEPSFVESPFVEPPVPLEGVVAPPLLGAFVDGESPAAGACDPGSTGAVTGVVIAAGGSLSGESTAAGVPLEGWEASAPGTDGPGRPPAGLPVLPLVGAKDGDGTTPSALPERDLSEPGTWRAFDTECRPGIVTPAFSIATPPPPTTATAATTAAALWMTEVA